MRHNLRAVGGSLLLLTITMPAFAQTPATTTTTPAPARQQRGDVAIGYHFLESDAALGVAVSDGFRVGKNVDFVAEATLSHGGSFGISVNAITVLGGIRVFSKSRYGQRTKGILEIEGGLLRVSASDGFDSIAGNGLGIKFGGGVDVSANEDISVRPQLDFLLGKFSGGWTRNLTFTLSVVFKLFKD